MGYFDSMTSNAFKTTSDGQKLFFPWGMISHGYIIPSEAEYERLLRNYKTVSVLSLVVGIAALLFIENFLSIFAVLIAYMLGYYLWVRSQCRKLVPTSEKLSGDANITSQSPRYNPVVLWIIEITSIILIGIGGFFLFTDPGNWLLAFGMIVFFGLSAIIVGRMLVVNNRQDGN